ncbi:MAG: PKD domain-containing protein [Desulfamplus sp.]|nr:PKD domain-containing protein [Desulfamplus sp.]
MKQYYLNIVAKNISKFIKCSTFAIWLICFTILSIHLFAGVAKATDPEVSILLPVDGTEVDEGTSILFSATVTDPDGDEIESYIWNASTGQLSDQSTFTTSTLKAGTHNIDLVVTDAKGEKGNASVTVIVKKIKPTITITSPTNGSSYNSGDDITFEADVNDVQDYLEDIKVVWQSSIDDNFGSGTSFTISTLSAGKHTIEATATDTDGNTDKDSISITIDNQPPEASILSPEPNATFTFGSLITFTGSVTDIEDGNLAGDSLVWTSSQGGLIGKGESVSTRTLKSGTHIITLTATDSSGAKNTAKVTITVGNAPPTATITAPTDGASFKFGETITLKGTGTDDEDGTLPAASLIWTSSSSSEPLGSGTSLPVKGLPSGTHTITLTVTDSEEATDSKQIVITIGNTTPVPVITSPANNSSHSYGKEVIFQGNASDAEDGEIPPDALTWSSDKDGILGSGESLSTTKLSINTHIITLTAKDNEGVEGVASIKITVGNASPVALITKPANNSSHAFGKEIVFEGTGTDNEDGELEDSKLKWSSDISGFLGYGKSIALSNLAVGTHKITLTATDSNSLTGVDTITIIVGNASPVALITKPANNSSHAFGKEIVFEGTATDVEDETFDDSKLKWTSDISGFLGYGTSLPINDLAPGTHTITLTVTDSSGATGTSIIKIEVRSTGPIAIIIAPADNSLYAFGEPVSFSGDARDPEGSTLDVPDSNVKWETTHLGADGTTEVTELIGYGKEIDSFKNLAVGKHTITFTVTDQNGRTGKDSITIMIRETAPVAQITSPENNSSYPFGSEIIFEGKGFDAAGLPLTGNNLKWSSRIEGSTTDELLGYGESLEALKNFAIGKHTITLTVTVTNSAGTATTAFDSIIIIITNTAPSVKITAPSTGSKFNLNEYIQFKGEATDSEDGELTGSNLVWTSNRAIKDSSGKETYQLGVGGQISINTLPIGETLITLTATDKNGLSAIASITVIIGTAVPPTVSILSPIDGSTFYLNDYIEFKGEASDNTDGTLRGDSLVWTSNAQTPSEIGKGNIFTTNTLIAGEHLITLTAKNSAGISGTDFIVITVGNHLPVPFITYPNKDKHTFDEGETISFSGYATDEEDGNLSGTSLSWTSNIDGYLGSGVNFSKALSAGEHTITLTAKDNKGGIAKTTIKDSYGNTILLTVNQTESSQPMTLENMEVSIPLGQVGEFTVSGGHPPYRYYKEYPYIASINIVGKKIKIVPQTIGSTTFNIVDHYNTTKILTLNVTDSLQNVPDADAGTDQNVIEGDGVVLDGTASFKGNNGIQSWSWVQVIDENSNEEDSYSSQKVVMLNSTSSKAMFVAPTLSNNSSSSTNGSKLTFRLTVSDKDGNKSYDDVDINVSDNGILGYPQGVTTFYTVDKLNHFGLRVVGDGDFVYINPQAPEFIKETINRPENMIYGVVDLKVKVEQGADANMIVYFPKSLGEEFTAYKYSSSKGWYEYSKNITFSSDRKRAYLVLSDGGEGDDDGMADGVISDPIAFGTKSKNPAIPETPSDGGGGGGGCFISTLLN